MYRPPQPPTAALAIVHETRSNFRMNQFPNLIKKKNSNPWKMFKDSIHIYCYNMFPYVGCSTSHFMKYNLHYLHNLNSSIDVIMMANKYQPRQPLPQLLFLFWDSKKMATILLWTVYATFDIIHHAAATLSASVKTDSAGAMTRHNQNLAGLPIHLPQLILVILF